MSIACERLNYSPFGSGGISLYWSSHKSDVAFIKPCVISVAMVVVFVIVDGDMVVVIPIIAVDTISMHSSQFPLYLLSRFYCTSLTFAPFTEADGIETFISTLFYYKFNVFFHFSLRHCEYFIDSCVSRVLGFVALLRSNECFCCLIFQCERRFNYIESSVVWFVSSAFHFHMIICRLLYRFHSQRSIMIGAKTSRNTRKWQ